MKTQEYLSSGLLELYIAGVLNESESAEITQQIATNPLLAKEVEQIERIYCKIGLEYAPYLNDNTLDDILHQIESIDNQTQSLSITNNRDIASSGILELYVAGALSEEESIEITHLIAKDKYLQVEVEKVEKAYIQLSISEAPTLDEFSLFNMLNNIDKIQDDLVEGSHQMSVSSNHIRQKQHNNRKSDISEKYHTHNLAKRNWQYLAAAALILMISAGASFFMMNEFRKTSEQIAVLDIGNTKAIDGLEAGYSDDRNSFMANSVSSIEVLLVSTKKDMPNMEAIIYWNNHEGDTYIEASKLPVPPNNKQWQVWAEISNVASPYNLGLLPKMEKNKDNFFKLQKLQKQAISFFITLEPVGGSLLPSPTQIYLKTKEENRNI
ncbi:MAG: anti-sigma factor [Chitinophagales bacterium]